MIKKIKSFCSKIVRRGKAIISAAVASVCACAVGVVASAEEVTSGADTTTMKSMMATAGSSLMAGFNDLVDTMIPVIIGILTSGLVLFGIFALIKLAKKIFGKVAG